jgi:methionyl-tRNA formyltransferase
MSLSETDAVLGAKLLEKVIEQFCRPAPPEGIPQKGTPSYCTLLDKDVGMIDWNKSVLEIDAQIRACMPWPLARTGGYRGQILYILEASPYSANTLDNTFATSGVCAGRVLGIDKNSGILIQTGEGVLAVSLLQYQTRKALPWKVFLNGARDFIGSCLSGGF